MREIYRKIIEKILIIFMIIGIIYVLYFIIVLGIFSFTLYTDFPDHPSTMTYYKVEGEIDRSESVVEYGFAPFSPPSEKKAIAIVQNYLEVHDLFPDDAVFGGTSNNKLISMKNGEITKEEIYATTVFFLSQN